MATKKAQKVDIFCPKCSADRFEFVDYNPIRLRCAGCGAQYEIIERQTNKPISAQGGIHLVQLHPGEEVEYIKAQVTPAPAVAPPVEPIRIQPAEETTSTEPIQVQPVDRKQQVKTTIAQLYGLIQALAKSVYQMELKDDQIKELAQKVLQELSKTIGEVTTQRIEQIAGEYLIVEAMKRHGVNDVHGQGSQVRWRVDPVTTLSATVRGSRFMGGRPFYTIEIEPTEAYRHGLAPVVENVSEHELMVAD